MEKQQPFPNTTFSLKLLTGNLIALVISKCGQRFSAMSRVPQACTVIASTGDMVIAGLRGSEVTGAQTFISGAAVWLPPWPSGPHTESHTLTQETQ